MLATDEIITIIVLSRAAIAASPNNQPHFSEQKLCLTKIFGDLPVISLLHTGHKGVLGLFFVMF